MIRRAVSVLAIIYATAGCALSRPEPEIGLTERIEIALDDLGGFPDAAPNGVERNFRDLYGLPVCREERLSKSYREMLSYDARAGIGYLNGGNWLVAQIGGVSSKEFDAAMTEVMGRKGFMEADAIYTLTCARKSCNGIPYCEGMASYRNFYRPADKLRVRAEFGARNYPRVHTLAIQRNAADHECAVLDRPQSCFPPGQRPN